MKRGRWSLAFVIAGTLFVGAIFFLSGCEDEATGGVVDQGVVAALASEAAARAPGETSPMMTGEAAGTAETSAAGKAVEDDAAASPPSVMPIENLVENAAAYVGKMVVVRGTILAQCIQGCRFTLDDGTGVVNIELVDEALENVLMQGSVGRIVEVRGIVDSASPPRVLVEDRDGWDYVG